MKEKHNIVWSFTERNVWVVACTVNHCSTKNQAITLTSSGHYIAVSVQVNQIAQVDLSDGGPLLVTLQPFIELEMVNKITTPTKQQQLQPLPQTVINKNAAPIPSFYSFNSPYFTGAIIIISFTK